MKIAVASTGNHVARHFALCERFHIYMVYGGGLGGRTEELFREKGISTQAGIIGDTRTAALDYLKKLRNEGALEENINTACIQDELV